MGYALIRTTVDNFHHQIIEIESFDHRDTFSTLTLFLDEVTDKIGYEVEFTAEFICWATNALDEYLQSEPNDNGNDWEKRQTIRVSSDLTRCDFTFKNTTFSGRMIK